MDTEKKGTVTMDQFKSVCAQVGTFLSNEDTKRIGLLFACEDDNNLIDFMKMSQDLQLHYSSMNYLNDTAMKIENLKSIMTKKGRESDLKIEQ